MNRLLPNWRQTSALIVFVSGFFFLTDAYGQTQEPSTGQPDEIIYKPGKELILESKDSVKKPTRITATYRGGTYNVLDTNFVTRRRMAQHRLFLKNEYHFPARPRNMWEIGVGAGLYNYSADVPTLMLWQKGGYGFHFHVRKAWGYVFSTRLRYVYGVAKGLQWMGTENYRWNPAWTEFNDGSIKYIPALMDREGNVTPARNIIHYNYRSVGHEGTIDFVFSTNNISFHKHRRGFSLYAFVGIGAFLFNTKINTLDANGQIYDFTSITGDIPQVHGNRMELIKKLQSAMDNTYETEAETERARRRPGVFGNNTIDYAWTTGLGIQFRVNNHVNFHIEERITVPHEEDLLDGQRWAEQVYGNPVFTQNNDYVNYLNIGINFNIGNEKRNVEPLYWLNPLDYVYKEVNDPQHMKVPIVELPDEDGDGVTDQFDQCPGTPEGVPVDVNGCPLDTDGDGIPDFRDKQLITPTECQPSDEDGIGNCPCPECLVAAGTNTLGAPCRDIESGTIVFDKNDVKLKPYYQMKLNVLANLIKAFPDCKVVLTGMGADSKLTTQRSWDQVQAVLTYLSEKHQIDRNHFIFKYGQPGDPNTVLYRPATPGESGGPIPPPPFPNLKKN